MDLGIKVLYMYVQGDKVRKSGGRGEGGGGGEGVGDGGGGGGWQTRCERHVGGIGELGPVLVS